MQFGNVCVVGLGLLGGSLGLALKKRGLARSVIGYARREATVREAVDLGAVDTASCDLRLAVSTAELVVLCTPIGQMAPLSRSFAPHLKSGAVVTDVGSVKGPVVESLEPIFQSAECHFVGSHPMAGSDKTGVAAARPELFVNAVSVVTPTSRSDPAAVRSVESLWSAVGARVLRLAPGAHDDLVARSSHLPHVVAAALASYVLSPSHPPEQPALCATGFRDTTRIASGSPEMWRDIALSNRTAIARALGVFIEDLQEFQRAIREGNQTAIDEFFIQAKARRDHWLNAIQTPGE